jgi:GNAT superfamily N-acetyltransferase
MTVHIEVPTEADIDVLHPLLTASYWSPGIPRETVARACANSLCAMARQDGVLVGFARLVTDRATFAWLCDVIVAPTHRGQGLGRSLVAALQAHPEAQGLRRWLLATRDAHGVYAPLGFVPLAAPDRMMEARLAAPYGVATS